MNKKTFFIVVGLAVIMVAFAAAYYFFVSLPQFNKQQLTDQEAAHCAAQAQNVFENETKSGINRAVGFAYLITPGDYSDYFNPTTHQCFVKFTYTQSDSVTGNSGNTAFYDAGNNIDIADCGTTIGSTKNTLTVCVNNLATSTPAQISETQYSDLIRQYTNDQLQ